MRRQKTITPLSSRDRQFFQAFYEDNKKFMYHIAGEYTSSQADREDIVQDAVIRLLKNISVLKELNRCKTIKYIVLTIRTAYLDNQKRKHGNNIVFLNDADLDALLKTDLLIADSMPDLSVRLEVERLKKELPSRDWLVLEGKYILGSSQEELAQTLGVAPDSIRMILCRAKMKARKLLEQDTKGGDA